VFALHPVFCVLIGRVPLWPRPTRRKHGGYNEDFTQTIRLVSNAHSTNQKNSCQPCSESRHIILKFYILLTVHHVMILGKWPSRTILFYAFIFIFNSLHDSSTLCSSSEETYCVNTTSGNCHCASCAGQKFTSDLHMTQPPTQSNTYQRMYWHNMSLLMMSTMCSKHVQS
jgi:hypothetical protein